MERWKSGVAGGNTSRFGTKESSLNTLSEAWHSFNFKIENKNAFSEAIDAEIK